MRFTTRTEYGLLCMIYLARSGPQARVSAREIASKERYPSAYIEKILQALKKADLVRSHEGTRGGYSLSRSAGSISVREVIDALEGATFEVFCEPEVREQIVCTHFCLCGVKPIWRRTKQLLDDFYGSVTIAMIADSEMQTQSRLAAKGEAVR